MHFGSGQQSLLVLGLIVPCFWVTDTSVHYWSAAADLRVCSMEWHKPSANAPAVTISQALKAPYWPVCANGWLCKCWCCAHTARIALCFGALGGPQESSPLHAKWLDLPSRKSTLASGVHCKLRACNWLVMSLDCVTAEQWLPPF